MYTLTLKIEIEEAKDDPDARNRAKKLIDEMTGSGIKFKNIKLQKIFSGAPPKGIPL